MKGRPMVTESHAQKPLTLCALLIFTFMSSLVGTGCRDSARSHGLSNREDFSNNEVLAALQERATGGDRDAQYELGKLYEFGKGVQQSYTEAVTWFKTAAERDHPEAQVALATLYRLGLGVPRQDSEALQWALKAAAQGNLDGQRFVAVLYTEGDDIPRNDSEAFKWIQRAAKQNDPISMHNYAYFYAEGIGTPQDLPEAYKWFSLAIRAGYTEATNALQELRARMTETQITEGNHRTSQALDP